MRRLPILLVPLALLLALNLAACGNKGPLVYATPAQDVEDAEAVEGAGEAGEAGESEEAGEDPAESGAIDADDDAQAAPAEPVGDTDPAAAPPLDPGHD